MTEGWDATICVWAPEDVVLQRLAERGLSKAQAQQRVRVQMDVNEKRRRADYVIENDGTLDELKTRTLMIWEQVLSKENIHHA